MIGRVIYSCGQPPPRGYAPCTREDGHDGPCAMDIAPVPLDYIETFTGRRFSPLSPDPSAIVIVDIAHALSHQCRFSGHTRYHYSVAQHSVLVSRLLEEQGQSREVQLWGLLHDASEAYLVDLPTPLKNSYHLGPAYRDAERHLMVAICARFGLDPVEPQAVRRADACALATEVRDLMPGRPEHWSTRNLTEAPHPTHLEERSPGEAKRQFLLHFCNLEATAGPT